MADFDTLPDRFTSDSVKWHRFDADVLPMWVADMDFRGPEAVMQALQQRVTHGVFGYPMDPKELREVVVQRMAERYGWKISIDDLVFVPGVVTGFNLVCRALAGEGSAALIQTPVYPPFFQAPANAGMERQEMELTLMPDGTYEIDFDAFEAAITERTKLFILCNPHNPVGRVFTRYELERMAEICLRHHVTICADEIHSDLVFPVHSHLPIASLDAEVARNTIALIAPSKTFNIAGLECSVAIIQDAELRKCYLQACQGLVHGINVLGQVAGLAAYKEGQPWLDEMLVYLRGNRDYLVDFVNHELPGVSMASPEGTYLAWLDCRQAAVAGDPFKFFLEKARVGLNDGKDFGRGGEGFVRLNFGCPRSMLTEALQQMKKALLASEK
jgi:cysteine-S-conjugate beta-lyase